MLSFFDSRVSEAGEEIEACTALFLGVVRERLDDLGIFMLRRSRLSRI